MNVENIISYLKEIVATETDQPIDSINENNTFFELGLDSINAVYLLELAEQHYNITLSPLDFWDYPTIEAFAKKIYHDHFQK